MTPELRPSSGNNIFVFAVAVILEGHGRRTSSGFAFKCGRSPRRSLLRIGGPVEVPETRREALLPGTRRHDTFPPDGHGVGPVPLQPQPELR